MPIRRDPIRVEETAPRSLGPASGHWFHAPPPELFLPAPLRLPYPSPFSIHMCLCMDDIWTEGTLATCNISGISLMPPGMRRFALRYITVCSVSRKTHSNEQDISFPLFHQ